MKTLWVNANTGERLSRAALETLRRKAHRAYEANMHIFEDEMDALSAFGVVSAAEFELRLDLTTRPAALAVA